MFLQHWIPLPRYFIFTSPMLVAFQINIKLMNYALCSTNHSTSPLLMHRKGRHWIEQALIKKCFLFLQLMPTFSEMCCLAATNTYTYHRNCSLSYSTISNCLLSLERQDLVEPWSFPDEALPTCLSWNWKGSLDNPSSFPCPFSLGYTHKKTVTTGHN